MPAHATTRSRGRRARRRRLQFGFSFIVNDGDETTEQQGWAGYYPGAIVFNWNGGRKSPGKVGVAQLAGADSYTPPAGVVVLPDSSGGCGGSWWWGLFWGIVLTIGVMYARSKGWFTLAQNKLSELTKGAVPSRTATGRLNQRPMSNSDSYTATTAAGANPLASAYVAPQPPA